MSLSAPSSSVLLFHFTYQKQKWLLCHFLSEDTLVAILSSMPGTEHTAVCTDPLLCREVSEECSLGLFCLCVWVLGFFLSFFGWFCGVFLLLF